MFWPRKIQKTLYFWSILVKITAYGQSFWLREAYNGAKWPYHNPFKTGAEEVYKFFSIKNCQKSKNFRKTFLLESGSEWFKSYFKIKIPISKIFSHYDFFLGTYSFYRKMKVIGRKKWQRQKVLVKIFSLIGIDTEWSKTYFKMKISFSKKKIPLWLFSGDIAIFLKNGGHGSKNGKDKNFLYEFFWSESIQNGPKRI